MKKIIYSVCLVLVLLCFKSIYADNFTKIYFNSTELYSISFTVQYNDGSPAIGVTAVEKGTTNGATSDVEGRISLRVASPTSVVVISMVGMSQSIEIEAQNLNGNVIVLTE